MAEKNTRICKVCGKEYPYCTTELKIGETFRWQDVACSYEHGAEYFAMVAAARGQAAESVPSSVESSNEETEALFDIPFDEDDFEDEDGFEDEEDFEDDEEDIENG